MKELRENNAERHSQVDRLVAREAEQTLSGRELAAKVAGSSQETASFFTRRKNIVLIRGQEFDK